MAELVFKCCLPIPPSNNSLKVGNAKTHKGFYIPAKYKEWQKGVDAILSGCNLMLSCVRTEYTFYPKNRTFGDTENYLKAVTDALVRNKIIKDDKHTYLRAGEYKLGKYDKDNPRVEVEVYKL